MAFHDDEDKEKDPLALSDEAVGEVLDEDGADEDEGPAVPLEDDEKAWE